MADRSDADILQIVRGQARQDPRIDVVVAERLLVLAQAQLAQPSPDVHPRAPDRASLPGWMQSMPTGAIRHGGSGGVRYDGGCLVLSGSSPIAGKAVQFSFDGGRLTSDAGVLVLADIERRFGIAERLARCIEDPRSPERVRHTLADMIRFRMLLIAAGFPASDPGHRDPAWRLTEWGTGHSPFADLDQWQDRRGELLADPGACGR